MMATLAPCHPLLLKWTLILVLSAATATTPFTHTTATTSTTTTRTPAAPPLRTACQGPGLRLLSHVCVEDGVAPWHPLRDVRGNVTQRLVVYHSAHRSGHTIEGFPDVVFREGAPPPHLRYSSMPVHFIKPTCPHNLYHVLHEMLIGLFDLLPVHGRRSDGDDDDDPTTPRWPTVLLTYDPAAVHPIDAHCLSLSPFQPLWDALPIMNVRAWYARDHRNVCYRSACFGLPKEARRWNAVATARYLMSQSGVQCRRSDGSGTEPPPRQPDLPLAGHSVVILSRSARRIVNLSELQQLARRLGARAVHVVDMATLSLFEQMELMQCEATVLLGLHGAEMMWGFFMAQQRGDGEAGRRRHVVEISWPGARFHSQFDWRFHESFHAFFARSEYAIEADLLHHEVMLPASSRDLVAVSVDELRRRGVDEQFLRSQRDIAKYSDVRVPVAMVERVLQALDG